MSTLVYNPFDDDGTHDGVDDDDDDDESGVMISTIYKTYAELSVALKTTIAIKTLCCATHFKTDSLEALSTQNNETSIE